MADPVFPIEKGAAKPKVAGKTRAPKATVCSIEDCEVRVLARGWCSRHYNRWQRTGDPLTLHERLKGDPNMPVASSLVTKAGKTIHLTVDGRFFEEVARRRRESVVTTRRYGVMFTCENCQAEAFAPDGGAGRLRFCSAKCSGPANRDSKLGRTKTTTKKKNRVDHLDRLFSILVRSAGVCVHCGTRDRLQCAHGFSRRYRNVRWDFRNAFSLCQGCHMFFTHRPLEWDEWLIQRWGADLYQEIRTLALSTSRIDLEAVKDELVAETKRLGITANQLPKTASGWKQYLEEAS